MAFAGGLQHLKHVEVDANGFAQGVTHVATQLPCLETLYLHVDKSYWGHGEVNVRGCQHLRHLVLKSDSRYIGSVLHEPKCRLGISANVGDYSPMGREEWAALQQSLHSTKDFHFSVKSYMPHRDSQAPWRPGVHGHLKVAETLTLDWPVHCTHGTPDTRVAAEDSENLVESCMPVDGQPFSSLKVLIIRAEGGMRCHIPDGLPKLEELVLHARGYAKVSFEKPNSTFSALQTCYILSERHLYTEDKCGSVEDMDQMKTQLVSILAGRSLTTSFVSARGDSYRGSACMYLRPITARELTYEELHDRVNRLARQCRCSACFDCLRRAGCLTWC